MAYRFFRSLGLAGLFLAVWSAAAVAADKPTVVATFSILGDLVRQVAGDHVEVTTLVGRNGDVHVFEPGPKESATLAAADMLVANGLGFEPWLERLRQAAGFKGDLVAAADGIVPLPAAHDANGEGDSGHGAFDPHAFQDLANGRIYVANIAKGLSRIDPAHAADFDANAQRLSAQIAALDTDLEAEFAAIPPEHRRVLTTHDAFRYFARAYGVDFVAIHGVSTEAEPTAKDLAGIVRQARDGNIKAIFLENMSDPRLIETVAGETDLAVGGELYADALSDQDGPAPDYLSLFRYNARQLLDALR